MSGLIVKYLPEGGPKLDDPKTLLLALKAESSNGGDGWCLCGGCLAYWALKYIETLGPTNSAK